MIDIREMIEMFRNAPRMGASEDTPEGARYIIISDTLANNCADTLSAVERLLQLKDARRHETERREAR